MSWPPLCRERLNRILWLLACHPQGLSVRDLARTYSVWKGEVEQAAALGCLTIEIRKPRTGRPARIAVVSKTQPRNLPPLPSTAPNFISNRYWWFALHSTGVDRDASAKYGYRFITAVDAYQRAFPGTRGRAGAKASASRLLRHPDVRAARTWFYACSSLEVPWGESMPHTAHGIYQRLCELGSPRVVPRFSSESTNPWAATGSLFAKCLGGHSPVIKLTQGATDHNAPPPEGTGH